MLTIVVPVYNVVATLERCVESIVSQSFTDWEMILVDDGSPDESGALADRLAATDDRIRVVHKHNGGLSDARNRGIEEARGEYITFVDSDDLVAPDTYAPLMAILQVHPEVDVLEYPVGHYDHAGHLTAMVSFPERRWDDVRTYWHSLQAWDHTYACNKVYRRCLFDAHRFPVGRVFEDAWLWPEMLQEHPVVMTTERGQYQYIHNDQGISSTASPRQVLQLFTAQLRAAWLMRTLPWSPNGWWLYRSMLCRLVDALRFAVQNVKNCLCLRSTSAANR